MNFAVEWSNFNMRRASLKEHHKALCLSLSVSLTLCVSLCETNAAATSRYIILKKWSVQFFGNTSGAPSGWVHELLLHDHASHELRLLISIHVWLWSLSDWIFYNHFDALWNFFLNFFYNLWIPTPLFFFFFSQSKKRGGGRRRSSLIISTLLSFARIISCINWMNE